jgi:hypothetical protein
MVGKMASSRQSISNTLTLRNRKAFEELLAKIEKALQECPKKDPPKD